MICDANQTTNGLFVCFFFQIAAYDI